MIKHQKISITVFLLLSTILYGLFGSIPKSHVEVMQEMPGHAICHDNHMENMVFNTPVQTLINHYDCCYQSSPYKNSALPKEFIFSTSEQSDSVHISLLATTLPSPFLMDTAADLYHQSWRAPPFHLAIVGSVLQLK